jgi:hypothetical protein
VLYIFLSDLAHRPTVIQGYSTKYPKFLTNFFTHVVYVCIYAEKKEETMLKRVICAEYGSKTNFLPLSLPHPTAHEGPMRARGQWPQDRPSLL